MDASQFPKTSIEFDELFNTEEACRNFLYQVRWPQGFICPKCKGMKSWINNRHLLVCSDCGHQVSLTAGTVMQGTRKPLRMWFKAIWWVCTQKTGGSAKGLQRLLGLGSYQTAWAWLHKLRRGMIRAGREPLEGPVEVDDAFVGGKEQGVIGRDTIKKARIVIAVEVPGPLRKSLGRIRIDHIRDFSAISLIPFIVENVQLGSRVITDGWEGYSPLSKHGYIHEVRHNSSEMLGNVHRVISLLKRWLLGTHQGAVRPKQLQHYLDEFTFRHNRRKSRHVGQIFYRMIQGTTTNEPVPYWRLVGRSAPSRPLYIDIT